MIAEQQFLFVKRQGLLPHHTMLDVGCGWLRGGELFIEYLEPGHYTGIEKDDAMLRNAQPVLERLSAKRPRIIRTEGLEIPDEQFDFGLMHSVITHMTPEQISGCLEVVLPRVDVLYATFNRSRDGELDIGRPHKHRKYEQDKTRYPFQLLQGLAMAAGASKVVDHGYHGHPGGQEWLEIRV